MIPKLNFIYYKNLLDICLSRFFEQNNNKFIEQNDKYVYCGTLSKSKLKNIFKEYLISEFSRNIKPYSLIDKQWYIVIGGCLPKNNILLKSKNKKIPNKLQKILDQEISLRYYLKENDIILDLELFNNIFEDIFNDFFEDKKKILKVFGKDYKNIIFLQHNNLDCLSIYNICKQIYGRSNIVNMYEQLYLNERLNLISINELIDKYVHDKKSLQRSGEFKLIVTEIQQFLSESMIIKEDGKE